VAVSPRAIEAVGLPRGPDRLARFREWLEQEHIFGYGLILPALSLLTCLVVYPFGMAIWFSLSDYWVGSPGSFVGNANYREILDAMWLFTDKFERARARFEEIKAQETGKGR
jgi:hypothetical protein